MASIGQSRALASRMVGGGLKNLGFQQITSLNVLKTLTVPTNALIAVLQAEAQIVRFRDDGTSPTAAIGMQLLVGIPYFYTGALADIEFLEETATAKLNVTYY